MSGRQALLLPEVGRLFARVAVPVPAEGLYSYRVPPQHEWLVAPGARVRVRFGGRSLVALVVETVEAPPPEVSADRLRDIDDCLDRRPLLTSAMLDLTRRVSERYMASWGVVAQLALPAGNPEQSARVRLAGTAPTHIAGHDPRRFMQALAGLRHGSRWTRVSQIARMLPGVAPMATVQRLAADGLLEVRDEWSGQASGRTATEIRLTAGLDEATQGQATRHAPAQRRAVAWLRAHGEREVDSMLLMREAGVSAAVLRSLEAKGLVERLERAVDRSDGWSLGSAGAGTFMLTRDQSAALRDIDRARRDRVPVLLHGVTGSGKTEVYLRAARTALEAGCSAILLVPEIGLTPQLRGRAQAVFGSQVAVLHSGLSASERTNAWWRLRRGEARVVVGPRSALFAPLADVGLVVVDEEQDAAYKQEERPRYHGRDVALIRGECEGAVVVLGSATPALGTAWRARAGRFRTALLPRRVAARPMPSVALVDMRREWKECGRTLVSRALEKRIEARLVDGEQALILLNRRGYASALVCRVCGARPECPECAVSLTLHRAERSLRCHYCDYRRPAVSLCPQCGADSLHELGHGTEQLQGALAQAFPAARIGRFDADQTRQKGAHARILSAFGSRQLDVLVGTQMLAKGHDFPGVTLVGVVGADAGLGMPDFRAAERTFQLLTQMAGRAGRGDTPGEVVLQAHQPGHYAIEAALEHDFETFYAREIEFRRRLRYPPFVCLAACLCRAKVTTDVKEQADRLGAALRRNVVGEVAVIGPASPPISRLRGKYRMQILLKSPDRDDLVGTIRSSLAELEAGRGLPRDLVVDIDPRTLM